MVSAGGSGLARAELMHLAMQASGARRKRQAGDLACCTPGRVQQQGEIRAFRRRLHWEASVLCGKTTRSLITLAHPCCNVVIGIGGNALPTRRGSRFTPSGEGVGSLNEFKKYV